MLRTLSLTLLAGSLCVAPLTAGTAGAATTPIAPKRSASAAALPTKAEVDALLTSSVAFLRAQQLPNGAFSADKKMALGFSQLAVLALLKAGVPKEDPQVAKGIEYIMSMRQADGGIYDKAVGMGNYCTSLALQIINHIGGDKAVVTAAQNYLFGLQNTQKDPNDPTKPHINNGGIGYGSGGAGTEDLSNTSFALQALRESGVPCEDPRMQAALAYLERCQDLSSVNKQPHVKDSGGAFYSADESKAGGSQLPAGSVARTEMLPYGSMTYQLIASYMTLDLKADDPRVRAALGWVTRNWRTDINPGMPDDRNGQGLFYYYVAMARTFDLLDQNSITLPDGRTVDWRADLFAAISQRAIMGNAGASWVNKADRWQEGQPTLVTAYVVQALARIKASL